MSQRATRPEGALKLATWNIHYGIGDDRRFDLDRIVAVLGEMDADIVGLQEVGWHRRTHHRIDHFAYLREHTGYTVVEGLVRDPLRSRFGNALLTRFPVTSKQWVDLKIRGHVPRAALVAEVESPAAPLRVAVLHLGLATWERERQAKRLIEALEEAEAAPPTVLLGDFNMLRARSVAGDILAAQGSPIVPDPRPEMRFFFRSDNLPFARRGIPAHTLSSYDLHQDYHTPADEADRADYPHMDTLVGAAIEMVRALATGPTPAWK